jgi:hypothetical protein
MGGNPYDLIDNKNQVVPVAAVPTNVQAPIPAVSAQSVVAPIPQQSVQAVVQQNNSIDINNPVVAPVQVAPVQAVVAPVVQPVKDVEPGGFTKKLIGFIAKISGQPNPET